MTNPFTLSFGKKPIEFISRLTQTNTIIETFNETKPTNQVYMITGVRGAGKTVFLTTISSKLREFDDWIVIELNPTRDLLHSLAAKLYSIPELHHLFINAKFDFSAFGLGKSIENSVPASDIETVLNLMFETIQKKGKRLLITIDEVTNNEQIKIFTSSFQIFIRQDYPVFLLMTGLYENIYDLQNDKSLTFLYRAPKIILEPLNLRAIENSYRNIFNLSMEQAVNMAKLTSGYPFAFQVLGHLYWENRDIKTIEEILPEYDQYLEEYVYEKIWSELSELDKKITIELSKNNNIRNKDLRELVNMKSELFSVYRERLKRKGILDTSKYGYLSFYLPRFDVFVLSHALYED